MANQQSIKINHASFTMANTYNMGSQLAGMYGKARGQLLKNINPMRKKDIADSSIFLGDEEEDSQILKEGSISKDLKIQQNSNTIHSTIKKRQVQQEIRKVGMSSMMSQQPSGQISAQSSQRYFKSFQDRNSTRPPQSHNTHRSLDRSTDYMKQSHNQRTLFDQINMSSNFASKTFELRHNSVSNFSKASGHQTQRNNGRSHNMRSFGGTQGINVDFLQRNPLSLCCSRNTHDDQNMQNKAYSVKNCKINASRNQNQNGPSLVMTQSICASVKPSQKLLKSPEFFSTNGCNPSRGGLVTQVTEENAQAQGNIRQEDQGGSPQESNSNAADANRSHQSQGEATNPLTSQNLPEGSSNFMGTTIESNNGANTGRKIPNELTSSSKRGSSNLQQSSGAKRGKPPLGQASSKKKSVPQPEVKPFKFQGKDCEQLNDIDLVITKNIINNQRSGKHGQLSNGGLHGLQNAKQVNLDLIEIEQQQFFQGQESQPGLYDFERHEDKGQNQCHYQSSNFNSNNTVKYNFQDNVEQADNTSDRDRSSVAEEVQNVSVQPELRDEVMKSVAVSQNVSQLSSNAQSSQISKIRQELQFPNIQMNKIHYYAENQFVLKSDPNTSDANNLHSYTLNSASGADTPATGNGRTEQIKSHVLLEELNELQDQLNSSSPCDAGAKREGVVTQISLQPSIQSSRDFHQQSPGADLEVAQGNQNIISQNYRKQKISSHHDDALKEICQDISEIPQLEESKLLAQDRQKTAVRNVHHQYYLFSQSQPPEGPLPEQPEPGAARQSQIQCAERHQPQLCQGQGQETSLREKIPSNTYYDYYHNNPGQKRVHPHGRNSSIMNCIQNSNAQYGGDPSSTKRQQLLENSCVTFQYYNSSKFASNSTNREGGPNNSKNIHNCFYVTKTTTNKESKESASQHNSEAYDNISGYNSKEGMKVIEEKATPEIRQSAVQDGPRGSEIEIQIQNQQYSAGQEASSQQNASAVKHTRVQDLILDDDNSSDDCEGYEQYGQYGQEAYADYQCYKGAPESYDPYMRYQGQPNQIVGRHIDRQALNSIIQEQSSRDEQSNIYDQLSPPTESSQTNQGADFQIKPVIECLEKDEGSDHDNENTEAVGQLQIVQGLQKSKSQHGRKTNEKLNKKPIQQQKRIVIDLSQSKQGQPVRKMQSDEKAKQQNQPSVYSQQCYGLQMSHQQISLKSSQANDSNDQSYTILQAASISAKKLGHLTAQGSLPNANPCTPNTLGEFKGEYNPLTTFTSNTGGSGQDQHQTDGTQAVHEFYQHQNDSQHCSIKSVEVGVHIASDHRNSDANELVAEQNEVQKKESQLQQKEGHQNNNQELDAAGGEIVFNLTNLGLLEGLGNGTKEGSLSKIQQYDNENSKDCMESLFSKMNMLNALCDTPDGDILQQLENEQKEEDRGPQEESRYSQYSDNQLTDKIQQFTQNIQNCQGSSSALPFMEKQSTNQQKYTQKVNIYEYLMDQKRSSNQPQGKQCATKSTAQPQREQSGVTLHKTPKSEKSKEEAGNQKQEIQNSKISQLSNGMKNGSENSHQKQRSSSASRWQQQFRSRSKSGARKATNSNSDTNQVPSNKKVNKAQSRNYERYLSKSKSTSTFQMRNMQNIQGKQT